MSGHAGPMIGAGQADYAGPEVNREYVVAQEVQA
jgi:hypothetical protein